MSHLLAERGWSKTMLADHAACSRSSVFKAMAGGGFRLSLLDDVAKALDVQPSRLLGSPAAGSAERTQTRPPRCSIESVALNLTAWFKAQCPRNAFRLAAETGIAVSTVYRLREGECDPHIDTIDRLAQGLGAEPWQVIATARAVRRFR